MTQPVSHMRMESWFVALALLGAALAPSHARAASSSGSIELLGTVPVNCAIAVQNLDGTLDLVAGEVRKPVAQIVETCNDPAGYVVTFTSGNAGALVSQGGQRVDYRIDYDTAANTDLAVDLVLDRSEARFDFSRPLKVSVAADGARLAGAYTDIITVTITAR